MTATRMPRDTRPHALNESAHLHWLNACDGMLEVMQVDVLPTVLLIVSLAASQQEQSLRRGQSKELPTRFPSRCDELDSSELLLSS